MNIYEKVLLKAISSSEVQIKIKVNNADKKKIDKLFGLKCFGMLKSIHTIINNDSLDDSECVDRIVTILNKNGLKCSRHDF